MMSAPNTTSGRSRRTCSQNAIASARECRRFMRLRIRSSPACKRQMQMRHQPRLARRARRAGRRRPRPNRSRTAAAAPVPARRLQDALDQRAERARRRSRVAGDVDAGEHDLAVAVVGKPAHLRHHLGHRQRARIAAAERDDAEGAAVVAAVLHLHEGARAAFDAVDDVRRACRVTAMMSATATSRPSGRPDARASSFSSLPSTRSTSGMAANVAARSAPRSR